MMHPLKPDHRTKRLLLALGPQDHGELEPHLDTVAWRRGRVLHDTAEPIGHASCPVRCRPPPPRA